MGAGFGPMDDKQLVALAHVAENADRYEDMCKIMKKRVLSDASLDTDERNLLSVAYKNVIGARRQACSTAQALSSAEPNNEEFKEYQKIIEDELLNISNDILGLLKSKLIQEGSDKHEEQVFYLKMAGDYYRYLNESCQGDATANEDYKEQTQSYYAKASEIATANLNSTHPIRLGLALNYSVCFYEVLNEPEKAIKLARDSFDAAISELDDLEEPDYKDSTLIMQLLRDNLTLWTQE